MACASAIPWNEAARHVGENHAVRGVVVDSQFLADTPGQPTFLDVGKPYPAPDRFSVVIWGLHRQDFPGPPERALRSRTICVTGTIDMTAGAPGVELSSPQRLLTE